MHMRYIESLLTLYDERNISKASQKLFITQQGLSRQIQTLEKELGIILFDRGKAGVLPTELCIALHPYFVNMFDDYQKAKKLIRHHKQHLKKPIIIAFAYGISHGLNTDVIFRFQQDHPEIHFSIKEWSKKKCIEKILTKEADIALLVNPFDMSLMETSYLAEGYMYLAIHKDHPFSHKDTIEFSDLDGQNIITGSEDNVLRELFDHYCRLTNIHPNIMFSSSYSVDIINSFPENIDIATVTPIMAEKITNPDYKVLRLITPEPGNLYLCTSKNQKKSKELTKICEYIKYYFSLNPIIKIDA